MDVGEVYTDGTTQRQHVVGKRAGGGETTHVPRARQSVLRVSRGDLVSGVRAAMKVPENTLGATRNPNTLFSQCFINTL